MKMKEEIVEKSIDKELEDGLHGEKSFLILHNDDFNTFDYVIESLIEICDHDFVQAEQCALITHHKGKCDVKKGVIDTLKPLRRELVERGLNVTIN